MLATLLCACVTSSAWGNSVRTPRARCHVGIDARRGLAAARDAPQPCDTTAVHTRHDATAVSVLDGTLMVSCRARALPDMPCYA
jgi:hypothetical protein